MPLLILLGYGNSLIVKPNTTFIVSLFIERISPYPKRGCFTFSRDSFFSTVFSVSITYTALSFVCAYNITHKKRKRKSFCSCFKKIFTSEFEIKDLINRLFSAFFVAFCVLLMYNI